MIKGHALTDFIVDNTGNILTNATGIPTEAAPKRTSPLWKFYTNGSLFQRKFRGRPGPNSPGS